jgi:putative transposase
MPTKKRIWYPGACYHITARGNHRNDIFKEEEDFCII